MKQRCIALVILLFCLQGLSADVALYSYGKGGTIFPLKSSAITMTYEKIDIDAYYACTIVNEILNCYYIEYRCYYEFQNHGNTGDFLLGFPLRYGEYVFTAEPLYTHPMIADFRLKINGRTSGYTLYTRDLDPELDGVDYDEVYGFSVTIEKKSKIKVEVFYTIIQTHIYNDDFEADSYGLYPGPNIIMDTNYILKSGSTLKDPIRKADITVQYHFPVDITINESPANPVIKKSATSPYTVISWELYDFVPMFDISICFCSPGVNKKKKSRLKETINRFKDKKDLGTYFQLKAEKEKNENQVPLLKKELTDVLVPFYKTCLEDENISTNLAGFIIADINKHPFLAPDEALVKQTRKKLEDKAAHYFRRDMERFKTMISVMEAEPLNWKVKRKAGAVFFADSDLNLLTRDGKKLDIDNYFLSSIFNQYKQEKWNDLKIKIDSNRKETNLSLFMKLLAGKKVKAAEIAEYIETFIMDSDKFHSLLEKQLIDLTRSIWNDKNKTGDAFTLEKLLHALHPLNYTYAPYIEEFNASKEVHDIFHYKRFLIRKAYYSLGNFYFGSQFDKSVFFYKMALVYGKISPFFDYLLYADGMSGEWVLFVDDLYEVFLEPGFYLEEAEKARAGEQITFLKTIYGNQKPWWKELIQSYNTSGLSYDEITELYPPWWLMESDRFKGILDLSEKAISGLYTPERLLKLNLSAWTQEGAHDAPCYFITYNMACALSRIEKGKESLDWLKVALKMNKKLKKTALKDTDLAYVREKFKREFDTLLNE